MPHETFTRIAAALLVCVLAGCGPGDSTSADKTQKPQGLGVTLSAQEIASLGIAASPAGSARYVPEARGFGVIVSLDMIAQSDADVVTAGAAATQSAAAAARARELSTGAEAAISQEALQAAERQATADEAALVLARRKSAAAFGRDAPWRDANARARIMAQLASGEAVLVHATFPVGAVPDGRLQSLRITRLGNEAQSWTANEIWDAPADPAIPGRGFFALVSGSPLAQGEHVLAFAPVGAAEAGVLIPSSAILYSRGETWSYFAIKPGTFLRKRVAIDKPLGGGYFLGAGSGVAAGQAVVTSGAGLLLAHETNPSTEPED